MSVMRVIILHMYTKFEVCRPSRSENMVDFQTAFSGLMTLTFDDADHHTPSVSPSLKFIGLPVPKIMVDFQSRC